MGSCYEHVLVACEPFLVGHILSRYHIYSSDRAHRSPKGRRHRQSKISASTCFATTTSILFSLPLISGSRDLAKQKKKKKTNHAVSSPTKPKRKKKLFDSFKPTKTKPQASSQYTDGAASDGNQENQKQKVFCFVPFQLSFA